MPWPSPGAVAHSTSRRKSFGCLAASDWATMPPIDQAITSVRFSLSARMSAAVLSAIFEIVSGSGPSVLRRIPALSKVITRRLRASASTKLGGQASIVPDRPMIITSGGPLPAAR